MTVCIIAHKKELKFMCFPNNESEVYCVDIKLSISSSVGLITSRNLKKKKEIVLGQISHI